MPDRDRVTQTSAYLRMLLLRPGEYRSRWERRAARSEPGKIDPDAVAAVLAGDNTSPGPELVDTARRALDGTELARDTRALRADVLLLTPAGATESEVHAITPAGDRRMPFRFRSPADGRRRALLSGLDLLRRVLLAD